MSFGPHVRVFSFDCAVTAERVPNPLKHHQAFVGRNGFVFKDRAIFALTSLVCLLQIDF